MASDARASEFDVRVFRASDALMLAAPATRRRVDRLQIVFTSLSGSLEATGTLAKQSYSC